MVLSRTLFAAAGLAGPALLLQPADAATARRHLPCAIVEGVSLGLGAPGSLLGGNITSGGGVKITNSQSHAIPGGTVYTITLGHHSTNVAYGDDLGPGASFFAAADVQSYQSCDASFPDTGYQTGGGSTPPDKKFTTFAKPKTGVFSAN